MQNLYPYCSTVKMLFIQLSGLSGAGKTTIANNSKLILQKENISVEIIDGDEFRKTFCKDLGFSKEDRHENIRRFGAYANSIISSFHVAIIAAINPYDVIRKELESQYNAKTVFIDCALSELIKRDPKGLYKRAMLPDNHPEKLRNLTGINDPYETPEGPALTIQTHSDSIAQSTRRFVNFIKENLRPVDP